MKCPFLAEVASRCGEGFARRFACKPAKWQGNEPQHRPVFEESITDFQTTLNLFHGPSGLVPVGRFAGGENVATPSHTPALQRASRCAEAEKPAFGGVGAALGTAAPFATISIPFFNFLVSIIVVPPLRCALKCCYADGCLHASGSCCKERHSSVAC